MASYTHSIVALGARLTGRGKTPTEAELNAIAAADRFELLFRDKMPIMTVDATKHEPINRPPSEIV